MNETSEVLETGEQDGSFSIINYEGYPKPLPQPEGTFRMKFGGEYSDSRSLANRANRILHNDYPEIDGLEVHELKPVKFGGDPVDPANKFPIDAQLHDQYTQWWRQFQKDVEPYLMK